MTSKVKLKKTYGNAKALSLISKIISKSFAFGIFGNFGVPIVFTFFTTKYFKTTLRKILSSWDVLVESTAI